MSESNLEARIVAFEADLGHRLPEDYRAWLVAGPIPRRSDDEMEDDTPADTRGADWRLLGNLYDLGGPLEYDLASNYEAFGDQIPPGLVPITTDPFGNPFCLGVTGDVAGKVYYVPVDSGDPRPSLIADSFTAFLNILRTRAGGRS